ncbi:ABC-type nitrate/sulfonate/bicarbonate transport system, permease component [Microlunatus sagamiharensis]|uniref:ABC-type nitrate/sulfonate/bicarbonate transport system, permease component n=1 Tax=Microlunatus sagamiharensis TaxID=546874 RepID=A0A1H2MZ61_9ACTN|nr:ABC transporter permease subunit [Microlunatus sagamiharensis]SDU98175.1 ABC-type nitrate/sulfonate/bicarbonate transport system, permease component [Microlunatus sagamiharensis]
MSTDQAAAPAAGVARPTAVPGWVGGVIGVVAIVVVWWVASQTLFTASGAIPHPAAVLAKVVAPVTWSDTLANLSGTLVAAAEGYLVGNVVALVLAALVLLVPRLEQVVTQVAIVTYCLPLVAIGPILVIVAGRDAPSGASVALAALSVFFTTVVGALLGLRAAPTTTLDVVAAYGGSRLTQLRMVRLVAALPNLFGALKIAAPAAFLGAVLAEYLGSGGDKSLGRALIAAQSNSDAPQLWFLALVSGGVAGLAYALIGLVGRLVTPWSSGSDGSRP